MAAISNIADGCHLKNKTGHTSTSIWSIGTKFGTIMLTVHSNPLKMSNFKNPRWRMATIWKPLNRNISATGWPLARKCGMLTTLALWTLLSQFLFFVQAAALKQQISKFLSANSKHVSLLLHLWQASDWNKGDGKLPCVESADKMLIFAVLKQWLLQRRETEASFCFSM